MAILENCTVFIFPGPACCSALLCSQWWRGRQLAPAPRLPQCWQRAAEAWTDQTDVFMSARSSVSFCSLGKVEEVSKAPRNSPITDFGTGKRCGDPQD